VYVGQAAHCASAYNDFALVEVDPEDFDTINPSVPFWG
jgi:hypothetical protein